MKPISAIIKPHKLDDVREAAATGQIGDGKIFVVDLEQALRIRTGESGNEAL